MTAPGTLSNRAVNALKVEKDTVFWDRNLTGFGVRVYPTGGKVYLAHARGPGGPKRVRVGRHGVMNAEEARKRAALIIARIRAGEDPVPEPMAGRPTVAEVVGRFRKEYVAVRLKPSTARRLKSAIEVHILPAFGKRPMASVTRKEVLALHGRMCETPNQANLVVRTLSQLYRHAEDWGLLPGGHNPCRGVMKYPERRRERFLTDTEFERLGHVLKEAEDVGWMSSASVAAIRLLMLTGCRKNEILRLRWEEVDLQKGELRIADSKTGARTISLSEPAVGLLNDLPRVEGNPHVLPGRKTGTHLRNLNTVWPKVCARAGLEDVRIHDLRHSYASRALALGESLPMIGKLLGHRKIETTARYAHLSWDSVQGSAERISESLAEAISLAPG